MRSTILHGGLMAALASFLAACSPPEVHHRPDAGGPEAGNDAGGGQGGAAGGGAGGAGGGSGGGGGGGGRGGAMHGYIYAHNDSELFRIDANMLVAGKVSVEKVGKFGAGIFITDLAVTPSDRIYGITPTELYEVNPDTGAATLVSKVTGETNVALTFDKDGTLLGADSSGSYRRIDPKTGTVTEIGNWGYHASGDIVGVQDGTLYGIVRPDVDSGSPGDGDRLIRVDPVTGKGTLVGKIGSADVWGAAFWCGKVYGFNGKGGILEIDVSTGRGTSIGGTAGSWWGAGVTPLAPLGGTVGGGDGCRR